MKLPNLIRTRRVSQTCRTHKGLTLRCRAYAGAAVPRFSFFIKGSCSVLTRCSAPDGAAKSGYFAMQKPEADGLPACMGGLLEIEQGGDTARFVRQAQGMGL